MAPVYGRYRNKRSIRTLDDKVTSLLCLYLNGETGESAQEKLFEQRKFSFFEGFFDEGFYSAAYHDLNSQDPREHFVNFGQHESRWPNPLFESDFYREVHSIACSRFNEDETSETMHFLDCQKFTCPSPLIEIESQDDQGGQLRGQYLAILYGLLDADDYAVKGFDYVFLRKQLQKTLSTNESLSLNTFRSLIYAYAFLSANESLFAFNGDPNFLVDDKFVNHLLQNQSFPRSIYSWLVLSTKSSDSNKIQLSHEFNIMKIAELLGRDVQISSIIETIKRLNRQSATTSAGLRPKISVLVICLDNARMLIASLGVLLEAMPDNYVEILILDNACKESDSDILHHYANFARIIQTKTQVSFGEANNILSEAATGEFFLFLNSDAFITSDSVHRLAIELDQNLDVVATAPILYFPDGFVQEAGGAWFDDGSVVQFSKGLVSARIVHVEASQVYRSASCLMVRRSAFERVGGFSFVFEPAYFEDTFLCAEIARIGQIRTMPEVKAVHLEGFTTNKPNPNFNKQQTISINRQKFVERVNDLELIPKSDFRELETVNQELRPVALLVSPYGLMIGGGEQYLLTLAEHLSETHRIVLAYPERPSRYRFRRVLWDLGINEFEAELVDFSQALWLRPDLLISMGNSLLPNFPPIGRRSFYHCQFPFPDNDSHNLARIAWADEYDAIVVQSTFTANEVMHACLGQWKDKVRVIAPPVSAGDFLPEEGHRDKKDPTRFQIISVGRFFEGQHCKNQVEIVQAFNELARDFDHIDLVLMGGVASDVGSIMYLRKVVELSGSKNISVRPDASRRSVLREFQNSDLYWHATGLGVGSHEPWRMEHFGIAPIEACQFGVFPFVHDSGGAGLNLRELTDACVYKDPDQLIKKTRSFLNSGTLPVDKETIIEFGNKFSVTVFKNNWDLLLGSTPL